MLDDGFSMLYAQSFNGVGKFFEWFFTCEAVPQSTRRLICQSVQNVPFAMESILMTISVQ
jgi:hypothetical protein